MATQMPSTVEVIPAAKRLVSSLRDMGYEFTTAVADLVDNSIEAGATVVTIDIEFEGEDSWVRISDNGIGMTSNALREALLGRIRYFGTWNSGSSGYHPPEIRFTASPLRGLFRPRQPDSRRTPSRILPCCRLIAFLRSTVMPIIRRRAKEVRESAVG